MGKTREDIAAELGITPEQLAKLDTIADNARAAGVTRMAGETLARCLRDAPAARERFAQEWADALRAMGMPVDGALP